MRIQHNIMAMNAYRNYNNNNKALSGNLEKLSSGYKINRAGDDAAGLAISEKMRAQITGLNAAQKNVKDGISLVKTAEGAMQEIQDMLNRMDYLATQSANGTYQDEVDREALQKEVNQLNDEINRIADSANFNGIKLLDGTWDTDAIDKARAAVEAAKQPVNAEAVYADKTADEIKGLMLTLGGDGPNSGADVGTKTVLETEKIEFQSPSFQVSMNGTGHTLADVTDQTAIVKLTINGQDIEINEKQIADYFKANGTTLKDGDTVTGAQLAEVFADHIKNTGDGASATAGSFDDGTYKWDVRADGENLVFEFDADPAVNTRPTTALNKHYDVSLSGIAKADVAATAGTFKTDAFTAAGTGTGTNGKVTVNAKLADGTAITFSKDGLDQTTSAADLLTAINGMTATVGDKTYKMSDLFDVTQAGGVYTFTAKEKGTAGATVTGVSVANMGQFAGGGTATDTATLTSTAGTDAYQTGTDGYVNKGTEVVIPGVPAESDQLASTTLDFTKIDITDGMKVTLGDTTYTFAVGPDSKFKDAENVVNMTGATADELKATGGDATKRAEAFSKLSEAAKDNETFTVSHQGTDAKIGLKQKAEAKDSTDMTTMDGFASYIGISTVDADKTAEAQAKVDAEQAEKLADAEAKLAELEAKGAKTLNLQIGDTSDSYNQLGVKIGSMKTTALGVDGLSIATAEDAAAAIDTIKDAINYVSSVRGDLGAYQNRLEHTQNNLSVMAENIQDAESTIRDTDVAEEMMSYVKNNILVQSAQAMLAQANQVPQGVLQLLG